MKFTISFSFLFIIIAKFLLCYETIAQQDFYPSCHNGTQEDNYITNSTYQHNLNTLLTTLTSNIEITYGFYNFTYGKDSDKVYAIGLCRGDVNPQDCRQCLNNSRYLLTQNCPNKKQAIGWTDGCMLRYSNRSIFGLMETAPGDSETNLFKATDEDEYNKVLRKLLYSLKNEAASGDSMKKYAIGNATGPNFQYIYGLMQCTPDLSNLDCNQCLGQAIANLSSCCDGRIGVRVFRASCILRYGIYRFYDLNVQLQQQQPLPPPPPPSLPSTNHASSQGAHKSRTAIIISIPIVIIVLVLCFICVYLRLQVTISRVFSG